jgi:hypothetical protein
MAHGQQIKMNLPPELPEHQPIILVAGLGRCGSSLVMRLLDAAGVPTVGTFPAFEEQTLPRDALGWVEAYAGRAVKVLDLSRVKIFSDNKNDGTMEITRSLNFKCLEQDLLGGVGLAYDDTTVTIQDSLAV